MKKEEKFEKAFAHFKKSYKYAMGGQQTVILPNGQSKTYDDRTYYSGRNAAKANANVRHDNIGLVIVTAKEYSAFLKKLREDEKRRAEYAQQVKEREVRIEGAKEAGVYSVELIGEAYHVELSDQEQNGRYFDEQRLAKTLDIPVEDVFLLNSRGKTYVFATQKTSGKVIELFHASLDCNTLYITFTYPSEERIAEFQAERAQWINAPYAGLMGQTVHENHFVC